jgi:hypothetical protein
MSIFEQFQAEINKAKELLKEKNYQGCLDITEELAKCFGKGEIINKMVKIAQAAKANDENGTNEEKELNELATELGIELQPEKQVSKALIPAPTPIPVPIPVNSEAKNVANTNNNVEATKDSPIVKKPDVNPASSTTVEVELEPKTGKEPKETWFEKAKKAFGRKEEEVS